MNRTWRCGLLLMCGLAAARVGTTQVVDIAYSRAGVVTYEPFHVAICARNQSKKSIVVTFGASQIQIQVRQAQGWVTVRDVTGAQGAAVLSGSGESYAHRLKPGADVWLERQVDVVPIIGKAQEVRMRSYVYRRFNGKTAPSTIAYSQWRHLTVAGSKNSKIIENDRDLFDAYSMIVGLGRHNFYFGSRHKMQKAFDRPFRASCEKITLSGLSNQIKAYAVLQKAMFEIGDYGRTRDKKHLDSALKLTQLLNSKPYVGPCGGMGATMLACKATCFQQMKDQSRLEQVVRDLRKRFPESVAAGTWRVALGGK